MSPIYPLVSWQVVPNFWKGSNPHIKPFLHVLCYFSSFIGPMHVWKLWCKSDWFEDVSKFSWVFLIFQKGHNTRYRTFLKKSQMSFRIFRKVIIEVGAFLKNFFCLISTSMNLHICNYAISEKSLLTYVVVIKGHYSWHFHHCLCV